MIVDDRTRTVGKLVSVAADRFVVELLGRTDNFTVVGFDSMHYIATLGSFVGIPVLADVVIAEVVGLREKDPSIGHRSDEPGLPKAESAKYLDVVPVGTLPRTKTDAFRFGVSVFPTLYADVMYLTDEDLDRIFNVANDEVPIGKGDVEPGPTRLRALTIGRSTIFQRYDVKVDVDAFFGGHAAVLGNTGSGKSCTVATILQSLFSKETAHAAHGATFVLLDVNGEYRRAFAALPVHLRRLYLTLGGSGSPQVGGSPAAQGQAPGDVDREIVDHLTLPHWFMTPEEWQLLLRASDKTQEPVLRSALGLTSLFSQASALTKNQEAESLRNHIVASCIGSILASDHSSPSKVDKIKGLLSGYSTDEINLAVVAPHLGLHFGAMMNFDNLVALLKDYVLEDVRLPRYTHLPFDFSALEGALDLALLYEESHGNRQIRDYCSQMLTRYKSIREKAEYEFLRCPVPSGPSRLSGQDGYVEWLLALRSDGTHLRKSAQVIVIDMNEAEDEVVEVASAVLARLVFDRLRRAEPRNRFPVNLVLEEAHRYVAEAPSRWAMDASRVFERIAKEGRKYGLFLLLASQRPSELSKTVLSQCSNFIVHRIQNPDDLAHIRQMTPFISENVLRRLPSLPRQHALIFGNATSIPMNFRVRDAHPRPKSDDSQVSELWFRDDKLPVELRVTGGTSPGA